MLIGPKVLLYLKVPIHPNVHSSQSSHALNDHLSHILICPKCPFALVLIFPGSHFPPSAHLPQMPTCIKAHRSQSAHLPQNAHFLKCPFVPVPICPFVPNTHLPKMLICPNCSMPICSGAQFSWCLFPLMPIRSRCPLAPMSISPNVPICSPGPICLINVHWLWCSFFLVPISSQCPFSPNAHLPQCPSVPKCPFAPQSPFAS